MAAADGGGEEDGGMDPLLGVASCVVEQPTTIETRRMLAILALPLAITPSVALSDAARYPGHP